MTDAGVLTRERLDEACRMMLTREHRTITMPRRARDILLAHFARQHERYAALHILEAHTHVGEHTSPREARTHVETRTLTPRTQEASESTTR